MSDWEIVETVGTDEEATLVAGYLESEGVPARLESLVFHQEPVTFGRLGEVRIFVPAGDVERARRLLDERDVPSDGESESDGDAGPAAG